MTTEQSVNAWLLSLKFNPRLIGFKLLREAILLAAEKQNKPFTLKKDIYPPLLQKYSIKAANLERNISNAIDNAFLSVDINEMEKVFGNTISQKSGKPTVKELIAAASVHILLYEASALP
jgi:hypothetical protein